MILAYVNVILGRVAAEVEVKQRRGHAFVERQCVTDLSHALTRQPAMRERQFDQSPMGFRERRAQMSRAYTPTTKKWKEKKSYIKHRSSGLGSKHKLAT